MRRKQNFGRRKRYTVGLDTLATVASELWFVLLAQCRTQRVQVLCECLRLKIFGELPCVAVHCAINEK